MNRDYEKAEAIRKEAFDLHAAGRRQESTDKLDAAKRLERPCSCQKDERDELCQTHGMAPREIIVMVGSTTVRYLRADVTGDASPVPLPGEESP